MSSEPFHRDASPDDAENDTESDPPAAAVANRLQDLQGRDDADTIDTAIEGLLRSRRDRRRRQSDLEVEAVVRELIKRARNALGDDEPERTAVINGVASKILLRDADLDGLIHDADGAARLAERLNVDVADAQRLRAQFKRYRRVRDQGGHVPSPRDELRVLASLAKALDYYSAISDMTPYAPVTIEQIDEPGARTTDTPQHIGRLRLPASSSVDPEERAVELPHQSCDHVLVVALPRRGKDSTIASIGKSLKEDSGYSYFSMMDDGRMETPMVSIPNDEDAIRQNLARMNQDPAAMQAKVYVPALDGLPDELPSNFVPFTIGIGSLTPKLILRLASVTGSDETVEARVQRALDETKEGSGDVDELVARLRKYAQKLEVTIEWTEVGDAAPDDVLDSGGVEQHSATYEMSAEKALTKAAQRLAQLAGDGLITGQDAATNLDMPALIKDQANAKVLCCNFLEAGREGLKYVIMDLWFRLIYQSKDNHDNRLPRVVLEIRELKNIAPTNNVLGDRHRDLIKQLRQTLFFLSTQGGSRRIMMLGSTQKLNDVYKPVRSNMATKILLQLGEEEIQTLDDAYNFSWRQKDQLKKFGIGKGMILESGNAHWPVEFRGAPCGLGLGDWHWRDRYGLAWGARVRESDRGAWRGGTDAAWWVDANTGVVTDADSETPPTGQWYLLPADLPDAVTERVADAGPAAADPVEESVLQDVLEERREYPVPNDLTLRPTGAEHRQRTVTMESESEEETMKALMEQFDVPARLRGWLDKDKKTVLKYVEFCEVLAEHGPLTRQADIAEYHSEWNRSALANHMGDGKPLSVCYTEEGGKYKLTPMGAKTLQVDWPGAFKQVRRVTE